MATVDIVILLILLFGFIHGMMKGFVMELAGFIGIIFSIYVARFKSGVAISLLESLLGVGTEISPVVAYGLTFIASMTLFHFVAVLVNKFLNIISLGWLNRLLGGVFSLAKYVLIVSIFVNLFELINERLNIVKSDWAAERAVYNRVKKVAPKILPYININDITGVLKHDEAEAGEVAE